ncbi:AAA family ATPase [Kribbella sp. NBC_01505]|uniref:ATP-binding protein n=1 Tax=Kribbella sp. NBC_01505 TaxID=2903580 RepID=UPI003869B8D6
MLLERASHAARLEAALTAAADGAGSVALVTGEAGIGKSSLLKDFTDRIGTTARVLTGACDDLFAPSALGPLRDAFRGTTAEQALTSGTIDEVLTALLTEFDQATPTVLIIEDIHWGDDATFDALRYFARRMQQLRALVVLSYRDDTVDALHPLRRLLAALTAATVHRIALEPLSLRSIEQLVAGSDWNATELLELTTGNPFFITELISDPGTISATVVDAVLARLTPLSAAAVDAVERLAVVPEKVDFAFAERLVPDHEALVEADQCGVLIAAGNQIGFRHEIARRAIEDAIPHTRRRALHRAVLSCLQETPTPAISSLVHHAVHAGDVDTLLVYGPRLARSATSAGSHREALRTYRTVLRHAGRLGFEERAALYEDCAWEFLTAGRHSEAVEVGQEAVNLRAKAGEPLRLVQSLLRQSRWLTDAGEFPPARDALNRAADIAQTLGSNVADATIATHQAVLLVMSGQLAEGIPAIERARDLSQAAGLPRAVSMGLGYLGVARCLLGDHTGLDDLAESRVNALAHNEPEAASRSHQVLAEMLYFHHYWPALTECLSSATETADEHGYWSHLFGFEVVQSLLHLRQNKWEQAEQRLRRLMETYHDPVLLLPYCYPVLGRLLARQGSKEAEPILSAAWNRVAAAPTPGGFVHAATAYLEWSWLNQRPDIADMIHQKLTTTFPVAAGPLFSELRRYLARNGIDAVSNHADGNGFELALNGDWRAAAAYWHEAGDTYEEALELAGSGDKESMLHGLSLLEQLGATPAADLVRRELRATGVRGIPSRATLQTESGSGLTRRQTEVLALLAEGITNAEIADRLVLSVRTVDHHVAAILTKLGATNRREAATMLHTRGPNP